MSAIIIPLRTKRPAHPQDAEPPPAPLTEWQRKFLKKLSYWPLPLCEGQRQTLLWIAGGAA
jgi:hypothetical protein